MARKADDEKNAFAEAPAAPEPAKSIPAWKILLWVIIPLLLFIVGGFLMK